jgi:hypothetical protein
MKRSHFSAASAVLTTVLALAFASVSFAQDAQPAPLGKVVDIRKIQGGKVKTPEYKLLTGQAMARTRDWFQVTTQYETNPEWVDDVTFTYYILVKGKVAGAKFLLLRGEVTYVTIQKGKHLSDMYLHPSTLARYGDVERVGVVVSMQGRVVAMDSLPASNQRWWEQASPVDGYVLNRMQTPFAMINFDDYEAIKARTGAQ